MTDDLVERLRYDVKKLADDICGEAADRIEKLEKALKFYAEATPDYLHGADWDWDCGEKKYGVMARHTLEDN